MAKPFSALKKHTIDELCNKMGYRNDPTMKKWAEKHFNRLPVQFLIILNSNVMHDPRTKKNLPKK